MREFIRKDKEESLGTEIENFAKNYKKKSQDKVLITEDIKEG